jgi:hypothetical protein
MKTLVLALTLMVSSLAWSGNIEVVSVTGQTMGTVMDDFSGSLDELIKKIDTEHTELEVVFKKQTPLKEETLQRIAQRIYKKIFGELFIVTEEQIQNGTYHHFGPFPCGFVLVGEYDQLAESSDNFIILSNGNGGIDTCTDQGGPGYWEQNVTVELIEYSDGVLTGKITIFSGQE